ncbi:MAG: putative Ig domain-containing protein [Xanthomonadales bacterium]|nr:putative Ig domain-containing protein [Xanthomonadales bacterium]
MYKQVIRNCFLIFGILLPIAVHAAPDKLYQLKDVTNVLPPHAKHNQAHSVKLSPSVLKKTEFTIDLFGKEVLVLRTRLESHKDGSFSWIGVLASDPNSEVVFAQHKGRVGGFVRYVEAGVETTIELTRNRDNEPVLYAVNPNSLPEIEPLTLPVAAGFGLGKKKAISHQQDLNQAPIVQKLLVAFTPAACEARGTCENLETDILAAIASTNQAYINSGLNLRIELAHLQAVDYVESGILSSLKQLTRRAGHADDPSGKLDKLHALRSKHQADLVSLISDDASYCGVSWINANAETAFSVVNWQCLSNRSLAHELGHNQGNAHNRLHAQTLGAYEYSFGHRVCEAETGFRTIMSYVAGCDVPRVNHFSNPLIDYNGAATGIAYTQSPQTAADNASTMANTAQLVAGFMQADAERLQIDTPLTQTHRLGDVVSLTLKASSVVGRPLSFNAGNLPSGLSINATTGVISGTVSQTAVEHQRVTAYVSDGFVEVAAEFTWLVPDGIAAEDGSAQFANDACMNGTVGFIYYAGYTIGYTKTECTLPPAAPEVVNPGLQTNLVGELVSVQIIASDANHDTLSYSATGLPANLTIDTTTGLISGSLLEIGEFTVTVTVNDGDMDSSPISFDWKVYQLRAVSELKHIWIDEAQKEFKLLT